MKVNGNSGGSLTVAGGNGATTTKGETKGGVATTASAGTGQSQSKGPAGPVKVVTAEGGVERLKRATVEIEKTFKFPANPADAAGKKTVDLGDLAEGSGSSSPLDDGDLMKRKNEVMTPNWAGTLGADLIGGAPLAAAPRETATEHLRNSLPDASGLGAYAGQAAGGGSSAKDDFLAGFTRSEASGFEDFSPGLSGGTSLRSFNSATQYRNSIAGAEDANAGNAGNGNNAAQGNNSGAAETPWYEKLWNAVKSVVMGGAGDAVGNVNGGVQAAVGVSAEGANAAARVGGGAVNVVSGAAVTILTSNLTPEGKKDEANGILGAFRQGATGTSNENAAGQLRALDAELARNGGTHTPVDGKEDHSGGLTAEEWAMVDAKRKSLADPVGPGSHERDYEKLAAKTVIIGMSKVNPTGEGPKVDKSQPIVRPGNPVADPTGPSSGHGTGKIKGPKPGEGLPGVGGGNGGSGGGVAVATAQGAGAAGLRSANAASQTGRGV